MAVFGQGNGQGAGAVVLDAAGAELTDEAVIKRVRLGEPALFELIMRRHNRRLYRLARALLGGDGASAEHEAEDVVQEAYVRAYQHLDQFAGRSSFSTWLTHIAANGARARVRSRRRESRRLARMGRWAGGRAGAAPPEEEPATLRHHHGTSVPPADHRACCDELRDAIAAALQGLPRPMRSVFVLREVEGLDTDETAQCLGITPGNVKVRLHRARGELRVALERALGGEVRSLYAFDGERCDRIVAGVFAAIGHNTGPDPLPREGAVAQL